MGEAAKNISIKLKEYREKAGLTVYELGDKIGKSGKTVSAWENGRGQPDADMFLKLCDILGVESVAVFFGQADTVATTSIEVDPNEAELLKLWRNTTEEGKRAAMALINAYQKPIKKENAI